MTLAVTARGVLRHSTGDRHVKAGKLVALGVASTKPVSSLPDVPPLAAGQDFLTELGIKSD